MGDNSSALYFTPSLQADTTFPYKFCLLPKNKLVLWRILSIFAFSRPNFSCESNVYKQEKPPHSRLQKREGAVGRNKARVSSATADALKNFPCGRGRILFPAEFFHGPGNAFSVQPIIPEQILIRSGGGILQRQAYALYPHRQLFAEKLCHKGAQAPTHIVLLHGDDSSRLCGSRKD